MKKVCSIIMLLSFICSMTTACTKQQVKKSMVQSKRRFAQYVESQKQEKNVVDLSEGPKLRYEANFGPNSPNFEIKIVDPY